MLLISNVYYPNSTVYICINLNAYNKLMNRKKKDIKMNLKELVLTKCKILLKSIAIVNAKEFITKKHFKVFNYTNENILKII